MKHKTILLLSLVFICINFDYPIYADEIKQLSSARLFEVEQYYESLKLFTVELKEASVKNEYKLVAEKMYHLANCLRELKEYKKFEELTSIAKPYLEKHNKQYFEKMLVLEADYLLQIGSYRKAIALLNRLPDNIHSETHYDLKLTLGDAYYRLDSIEACRIAFLYVYANTKDSLQKARSSNALGSYHYIQSSFDSAAYFYRYALALYQQQLGNFHSRTLRVKYNLGLLASRMGDYKTAETYLTDVLQKLKKKFGEYHPQVADAYAVLGGLLVHQGNIEKAIYYFKKDRAILEKLYGSNQPDILYSYLNCGTANLAYEDYANAALELKRAIELAEYFYGKKHNLYSQCAIELSRVYMAKHQYEEAEILLQRVIQNHLHNEDYFLADAYLELGSNFLAQKKYNAAIKSYEKAENLYQTIYGDKNVYSLEAFMGMSDACLGENEWQKAYVYANKALNHTKEGNSIIHQYDYWVCKLQQLKCRKALYENKLLSPKNSKADIEEVVKVIKHANTIKQTYYQAESKLNYAEKMAELYQIGIFFLTNYYPLKDDYFFNQLLFFAENNKAGLLRSKLNDNTSKVLLPLNDQQQSDAIISRLNYFMILQEDQTETTFVINDSILFYQEKYEQFTKAIERKYPKIYAIKYGEQPMTYQKIQKQLHTSQTYLSYCNDGKNYYCISISPKTIEVIKCGSITEIDTLIQLLNKSILEKKFQSKASNELFKKLLPNQLNKQLIISPDLQIQFVSFDVLSKKPESPYYLINEYSIVYTFSAATYFREHTTSDSKAVIGFFPDFSNSTFAVLQSKDESEALAKFSQYQSFEGKSAGKQTFLQYAPNSEIIHLATHLITDTITPLNTHLLFHPEGDYTLSINEVRNLNLHTDLVTLAACQTNFGKQHTAEGMLNFAWAFNYSGAKNILSTNWDASDKACSYIMSRFYTHLHSKYPKAEALRLAKLDYLKNADAISIQPFFWSNFMLFGTQYEDSTTTPLITYICLSIAAVIAVVIYKKRK